MKSRRRLQNLKGSALAKIERIVRQYPKDGAAVGVQIRRLEFESIDRRQSEERGFRK